MRRRHNIVAATLLVFGITFLCARREGDLLDHNLLSRVRGDVHGAPIGSLSFADVEGKEMETLVHQATAPPSRSTETLTPNHQDQLPVGPAVQEISQPLSGEHSGVDILSVPLVNVAEHPPGMIDDAQSIKAEYAFQEDLDLYLPLDILQRYSNLAPHNNNPDGPNNYAYATFMATRNPSLKDPYFLAIHSLIYRILWSPRTRTQNNHPIIVFVASFVTHEQRALLSGAGAIIRELSPLEYHCAAPAFQPRWQDLFAKLNMWAEPSFSRILFLDADAFPLANIDHMFDMPPVQECIEDKLQSHDFLPDGTAVCEPYIFAGVPQDPFNATYPGINVGSMVFTPSARMHQRLVQNYLKTEHYDCAMAEQAFLNWQFGTESAYPPTKLDREWGGYFPQEDEEGRLKVVHEKIWAAGDGWMKKEWERGWEEMVRWYGSPEFAEQRSRR